MKTYTLQKAQQLVADGKAVIENDDFNSKLIESFEIRPTSFKWLYYSKDNMSDTIEEFDGLLCIKLSQIQPEPIPNDVIKIVEKYGKDKILTLIEKI